MANNDPEVNPVLWPPANIDVIEASLSTDRLSTYMAETSGDKPAALRLYAWNTAVSGVFYAALQVLEISMRNSFHRELTIAYGVNWYDELAVGLDNGANSKIDNAKRQLRQERLPVDSPHIIANLSFGFWVSLLGSGGRKGAPPNRANYEMTLWRPALRHAYMNATSLNRRRAHRPVNYLRMLRKRIAHHEPIFNRHLQKDLDSILEYTRWFCEPTHDWLHSATRIPKILADKNGCDPVQF